MSSLKEIEKVLEKIRNEKFPELDKTLVEEVLKIEASYPDHPADGIRKIQEIVEKFLAKGIG
jgi:hypothetical protein